MKSQRDSEREDSISIAFGRSLNQRVGGSGSPQVERCQEFDRTQQRCLSADSRHLLMATPRPFDATLHGSKGRSKADGDSSKTPRSVAIGFGDLCLKLFGDGDTSGTSDASSLGTGIPHSSFHRERRRTLRYRNLLVRQMVQMKIKISTLLMEAGVSYNKKKLHQAGYFRELLATNPDINEGLRPLLRLCRETVVRLSKLESALVRSLERDHLLVERVERLLSIPAAGPITALTWALEIGEVQRFSSIKKAISYCGLCGDEQRSANSAQRTPLSKQRSKHLQTTLIEAAKMAPRFSPTLALLYDREKQKGNANRATLAVARKLVAYLMAVDRGQTHFLVVDQETRTAA